MFSSHDPMDKDGSKTTNKVPTKSIAEKKQTRIRNILLSFSTKHAGQSARREPAKGREMNRRISFCPKSKSQPSHFSVPEDIHLRDFNCGGGSGLHNFKSASVTAPSEAPVTVWAYLASTRVMRASQPSCHLAIPPQEDSRHGSAPARPWRRGAWHVLRG